MGSEMLGKFYALLLLLPKFNVSINASSHKEVCSLSCDHVAEDVSVHEATFIHLSAGQAVQVSSLKLQHLSQLA